MNRQRLSAAPACSSREGRLEAGARALGIELTAAQRGGLLEHLKLLARWNRAYNLVAASTLESIVETHVLDSLSAVPFVRGPRLLDIGTGAGFPGLVLAIAMPSCECILLDGAGKRTRFCQHVVAELGLGNVEVVHGRAERLDEGLAANTVIARAVTSLQALCDLAGRHLGHDGRVVALKGRYPSDELTALAMPGVEVHRVAVPGLDAERHIVTVDGLGPP